MPNCFRRFETEMYSARISEYLEGTAYTPCSKNFLTFHMVMRLVGEEEMTMMGLVERAFLARFRSAIMGYLNIVRKAK